jgi:DNA-directed RNA polymerase specialized sigma24 family protein
LADGNYKERASRLGVAVGTVRSRLHRARAALSALRRDKRYNGSRE